MIIFGRMVQPYDIEYLAFWFLIIWPSGFTAFRPCLNCQGQRAHFENVNLNFSQKNIMANPIKKSYVQGSLKVISCKI